MADLVCSNSHNQDNGVIQAVNAPAYLEISTCTSFTTHSIKVVLIIRIAVFT